MADNNSVRPVNCPKAIFIHVIITTIMEPFTDEAQAGVDVSYDMADLDISTIGTKNTFVFNVLYGSPRIKIYREL